jgi:GNAT superfamily N-acetyltransferase
VDPDDDEIQRYVVRRYAYDPLRRERRHQVVAAYDSSAELVRVIDQLARDLQGRRAAGRFTDPLEHYTGVALEPGYRRKKQAGRLLRRAIRHGATIPNDFMDRLELPSNVSSLRALRD